LFSYIAKDEPRAAAGFAARLDNLAPLLTRFPLLGRPTDLADIRTISLRPYPYRLFYRVATQSEEIQVLRIRHTRRAE
jgi:plasmid stabilization system protein ParE